MKKLLIASALSAAFVSPAVFAQAQNFEGFGLQLSTGYQNNELKFSDLKADQTPLAQFGYQLPSISKGEMPLNLGIGYTQALNEKFTLGVFVEYNPLSMKTGSATTIVPEDDTASTYSGKLENQVSVSLVPGYAFTDTTMGYAKLGWINANAKISLSDGDKYSKNTNGVLLGIGARHLFTKNVYGFAEATYAAYSGATASQRNEEGQLISFKMTPTSYSFLVGVGVRF